MVNEMKAFERTKNSADTIFEILPMKNTSFHAGSYDPLGEYWIKVTRANGSEVGIGQFDNPFNNFAAANIWIEENKEGEKWR
jgi:hypothetical protein